MAAVRAGGAYRRVLRSPGVRGVLVPYVFGRIGSAMVLLALLLHVQQAEGSFVQAGLVTASFALSVAVCAPWLGRWIDRHGQGPTLLVVAVLHPLALSLVVLGPEAGRLPAAALAGATVPPLAACMRALWPALVEDDELRPTAFTIESLVVEACELGGPLLVGLLVAGVSPTAAVLLAAGLAGVGTLCFALSPAARRGPQERRRGERRARSPLSLTGLRRMVLVIGVGVGSVSALEVSVAAFATEQGSPSSTGWLLGCWVGGSLLAGWLYGARPLRAPLPVQLWGLLLAGSLLTCLPLLAVNLWMMGALLAVAGLALAPGIAVQFAVLSELAPDRRRTESFTWASTAAFLGVAVGNVVGGVAVQGGGFRLGVGLSVLFGVVSTALAWAGRHRLGLPRMRPATVPTEHYDDVLGELDQAWAAVRATGARNDELARQLALLRMKERDAAPILGSAAYVEHSLADARRRLEELVASGLPRLDSALADLHEIEERRAALLAEVEELRSWLLAAGGPNAKVSPLPMQGRVRR